MAGLEPRRWPWRRLALLFVAGAGVALAACGSMQDVAAPQVGLVPQATVERVIDGDTVDVVIDGRTERVRLLGVDTPESVARNVPEQCFGAEAAEALAGMLPPGTTVEIERDVEARDRYGRLLLYLRLADDGTFVNRWLVANGLAEAVSYEPNTAHESELVQARHRAAAAGLGLWGRCDGPDQPLS